MKENNLPELPFAILPEELKALRRFHECVTDGECYDVPKEMMRQLAEIGLVRRVTANYYEHTTFGLSVLNGDFTADQIAMDASELPPLPKGRRDLIELHQPADHTTHVCTSAHYEADQMQAYALAAIAADRAKREGVSLTADRIIFDALRRYKLSHAVDEFGGNYSLVDLLTPDGRSISEGEAEMELIADAIACAISDRALLANAPQVQEWLPIEIAPKDGTYILLGARGGAWVGKYQPVYQSGYKPDNPWSSMMLNHDHMSEKRYVPTHWMPLPAAPQPEQKG